MSASSQSDNLKQSPLHAFHLGRGAKMVPFAGYAMPLHFAAGILAEHRHCRAHAALFDVSHMGQITVTGVGVAAALETLIPADLIELAPGAMRYAMFTNDRGGIVDDLIVTATEDGLRLVVNAACKESDFDHVATLRSEDLEVSAQYDRALLALQGPSAARVLASRAPGSDGLAFMTSASFGIAGCDAIVSRSGYTGEDGFEISVAAADAETVAESLFADDAVMLAGLGARDSLRLEAGLCLYGHDIDTETTPIEAGLAWTIGRRRRTEGGFPGADTISAQLTDGPTRRRVGLCPEGRAIARVGARVLDADGTREIGRVTSGGYGPTVEGPIAMAYVAATHAKPGVTVQLDVRGRQIAAEVTKMPFVPHRYHRD